jgi:hypothetical protein
MGTRLDPILGKLVADSIRLPSKVEKQKLQYLGRSFVNAGAPDETFDENAAVTVAGSTGYRQYDTIYDTSVSPADIYRCIDASAGAAIWVDISLTADEVLELINAAGGGGSTTPLAITYADPLQPNFADGACRKTTLTGNMEINPPINGTEGDRWELWATCDATPRELSLDDAIIIPSDSTFNGTQTLAANKTYIVVLKYNGSVWWLISLVGGF